MFQKKCSLPVSPVTNAVYKYINPPVLAKQADSEDFMYSMCCMCVAGEAGHS